MASHAQMLVNLVRRGADMMTELPAVSPDMDRDEMMMLQQQQWNDLFNQLPRWGIVMVLVTMFVLHLLLLSISYTIGRVVLTLAMIETPTVDYIPVATLDALDPSAKDATNLTIDGEAHAVVNNKPITSRIRRTIRHLHTHAGAFSRWRGLGFGIVYNVAHGMLYFTLRSALASLPLSELVTLAISTVALSQLHCAWTHKMITMPSPRSLASRIPPRNAWRQLWIPNTVAAVSGAASLHMVVAFAGALGRGVFDHEKQQLRDAYWLIGLKVLLLLSLALTLLLAVVLPVYACLTRIEATLLPDDEDTIVPFDRTLGGKVTPVVVGGSGLRYCVEVYATFDREALRRIMALCFKGVLIAAVLVVVYIHIVSFELFFIIGPVAKQAAKKAGARMLRL